MLTPFFLKFFFMMGNTPKGKLIKARYHCKPIDLSPPPNNQQSYLTQVTVTPAPHSHESYQNSYPTLRKVKDYDNLSNNEKRWWGYTLGPGTPRCVVKPRDINAEDVLAFPTLKAAKTTRYNE